MTNLLKKFGNRFCKNSDGSVAIETSIILPLILIPLTLATVDVGIAVNSGQSLTSASRSGTQYLLNGGDVEADLKGTIVNAYNGSLSRDNIAIATSCACPNDSALPSSTPPQDGTTTSVEEQPYSLRNVTLATMDQCSASCNDASSERVLVNLSISHTSQGLYKDYPLRKEVSVRVK
jgi:Flp pilus assembly protein TadG